MEKSSLSCKCCGSSIIGQFCEYCGFINADSADMASALDGDAIAIQSHRANILAEIKNISVNAGKYEYDEAKKEFVDAGEAALFPEGLDGSRCAADVVQSSEWIAHFEGDAQVHISYEFGGAQKQASAKVRFPKGKEGIWYLGLHINTGLRLEVYLCIEAVTIAKKARKPKPLKLATVDLDLKTLVD